MAELLTGRELMRGIKSEMDLISKMCEIFGTPNASNYGRGYHSLKIADAKSAITLKPQPENRLKSYFPNLSRQGFDLLSKMLCYDPDKRITAEDALTHAWFKEFPLPVRPMLSSDGTPRNPEVPIPATLPPVSTGVNIGLLPPLPHPASVPPPSSQAPFYGQPPIVPPLPPVTSQPQYSTFQPNEGPVGRDDRDAPHRPRSVPYHSNAEPYPPYDPANRNYIDIDPRDRPQTGRQSGGKYSGRHSPGDDAGYHSRSTHHSSYSSRPISRNYNRSRYDSHR